MERKRTAVKLLILIPLIANILRVIGLLGSILLDAVIPVFITSHSKIFDTCGLVILIAESIADLNCRIDRSDRRHSQGSKTENESFRYTWYRIGHRVTSRSQQ